MSESAIEAENVVGDTPAEEPKVSEVPAEAPKDPIEASQEPVEDPKEPVEAPKVSEIPVEEPEEFVEPPTKQEFGSPIKSQELVFDAQPEDFKDSTQLNIDQE